MSRDQRAADNWALLHAQALALEGRAPLAVAFCLVDEFLGATLRQYAFMLRGLEETAGDLAVKGVPFFLLPGRPQDVLPPFLARVAAGAVVCDFDPLRIKRQWKRALARRIKLPLYEVDAHNIVPRWLASNKQEYAARTFRPKITRLLPEFLTPIPSLKPHPVRWPGKMPAIDWPAVLNSLKIDRRAGEVDWLSPGPAAARKTLRHFIAHRLAGYDQNRNDPNIPGQSDLSPYLHFGQISAQRVALAVAAAKAPQADKDAFLEQLIVRRELSDNFCHYNSAYDRLAGGPAWARANLRAHLRDPRPAVYSLHQLETARTGDALWNAAQMEMVRRGKMHGYMRMYWAKKLLEWTRSPATAIRWAIYLNDRYELDGRDPNGYVGILWSLCGLHDRPWPPRPIYGTIRSMTSSAAAGKFDVEAYIPTWPTA